MLILKMSLNSVRYQTTYKVVHTLYEYIEFFYYTFLHYYQIFLNVYHKFKKIEDFRYIAENVKILDKKPTHITIILANETPSYNDLAKLVMWCIASGVPYISFYDYKGVLKNSEDKLQKAVEEKKPADAHVIWHNKNSYRNGFVGTKVHIRTLSLSDGRESIANTTKKLCQENIKNINLDIVDRNLKEQYVFPDPDLCLYCGQVFTLYGYPPWEVRLTEFIGIRTHHCILPRTFVKALYRYSKTEVRLGK